MIPRFKRMFHVTILEGRGVLLITEDQDILLKGRAIELVAGLIDGKRTEQQILNRLRAKLKATEVFYCLLRLEKEGYITYLSPNGLSPLESFWHQAGLDAGDGYSGLHSRTASLHSTEPSNTVEAFKRVLQRHGVQIKDSGDLNIILTPSYLDPKLAQYNHRFLETKKTWLLVKPFGRSTWIGPLFHPGRTGCWACLHHRLEKHRVLLELAVQESGEFPPSSTFTAASIPASKNVGINLAVMEVLRWFSDPEGHPLLGKVRTFEPYSYESNLHVLTRRPQCSVCGIRNGEDVSVSPISLTSQKKTFRSDGGYRTVPPESTFDRYRHHISPVTGIVKHVRPLESDLPLIQTYAAAHNLKPVSNQSSDLPGYLRDQSSGKGCSPAQARTSALCEALERYSAVFHGDEVRINSSLARLGEKAIHPNDCMHFSENQYATRDDWHRKCSHAFQFVPEPFDSEATMEWTPVRSLMHGREYYLPTAYCYFNYDGPCARQCRPDSNGNAAGNTIEEAILQGIMEVIERDCVSIWWYNRIQRPAVDLSSFNASYFERIEAFYHSIQRDLWVLDISTDFGIPAFAALSRRNDRTPEDIILGFGAHLNAELAIQRALTEMNQLLPFVLRKHEDGSTHYLYDGELELKWWQTVQLDSSPFLAPHPSVPLYTSSQYTSIDHDDLRDDIEYCLQKLSDKGMDVLVLDQTRPDIELPVVKVIVPETRIFWRRLGTGRLYDVPVDIGWLDTPTPESELNPFPFFL